MNIWSPKRWYPIQCDFSAMLSPRLFEAFALPYLKEQRQRLEHAIYHLDGPGQIPHLSLLLEIPELNGIQWVPGAGRPDVGSYEWIPLYKKIQEKGKLLVLSGVPRDKVEPLLKKISSKGLLLQTSCSTEGEARELLGRLKV